MQKSIAQVEQGLANYIDAEFTNKLSGFSKFAFATATVLMMAKSEQVAAALQADERIKAIGIIDECGMVDVDLLKQIGDAAMDKVGGSVTETLPVVKTTTFGKDDVDKLYRAICSV